MREREKKTQLHANVKWLRRGDKKGGGRRLEVKGQSACLGVCIIIKNTDEHKDGLEQGVCCRRVIEKKRPLQTPRE